MQAFYNEGFSNLKYTDKATEPQPYSYSFAGFLGSLDHALASDSLLQHVVSVDAWHINSVEDSLMDYQTEENGQAYDSIDHYAAPDAYRSSDHDPIVVALELPGGT
jgi:predicted extracellular nuclease